MGTYINNKEKKKNINLLNYHDWTVMTKKYFEEQYEDDYDDLIDSHLLPIIPPMALSESSEIENLDPVYPDAERRFELAFSYDKNGIPQAESIWYPAYDEDDYRFVEGCIDLNKKEKIYFTNLLIKAGMKKIKTHKTYGVAITYSWDDEGPIMRSFNSKMEAYKHACTLAAEEAFYYNDDRETAKTVTMTCDASQLTITLKYDDMEEYCFYKVVEIDDDLNQI